MYWQLERPEIPLRYSTVTYHINSMQKPLYTHSSIHHHQGVILCNLEPPHPHRLRVLSAPKVRNTIYFFCVLKMLTCNIVKIGKYKSIEFLCFCRFSSIPSTHCRPMMHVIKYEYTANVTTWQWNNAFLILLIPDIQLW